MLRWAVPIFLAGLGGLFSERAGVVNIGLEGMIILGMWFGAWGSIEYGAWWGLLIGVMGGALGGLLHAIATVTFQVDQERAVRIAPQMPAGVVRVAESGVRDRSDAAALTDAGYHALLVGETLVKSGDPALEIRRLRGQA